MWVKLRIARVTAEGLAQWFGQVIEVNDADGRRMLAAGQCVLAERPAETAMMKQQTRGTKPERAQREVHV